MLVRVQDRRAFLKSAAASAVAAAGFVNLNPAAMGANEKVTLALIGGRNQGNGDALRAIKAGARFKTFCDLDPKVLEKTGACMATRSGTPARIRLRTPLRRRSCTKSFDLPTAFSQPVRMERRCLPLYVKQNSPARGIRWK